VGLAWRGQPVALCSAPGIALCHGLISLSLSLRGPGVRKEGERKERAAVADAWAILGSTRLNGCDTVGVGPQDRGREGRCGWNGGGSVAAVRR
jgi:hypothetical protein